jgi:hypothetical protein
MNGPGSTNHKLFSSAVPKLYKIAPQHMSASYGLTYKLENNVVFTLGSHADAEWQECKADIWDADAFQRSIKCGFFVEAQ